MSQRKSPGLPTQICPRFLVPNPPLKLMVVFQGDVLCLHILGEVVVVLCSLSAIKDLLEKRGQVYSDRHQIPILEMCAHYYYIRIIFRVDGM